jgi:hypothetical protein
MSAYTPDKPKRCWFGYILCPLIVVGYWTCLLYKHPNKCVQSVKFVLFLVVAALVGSLWVKIIYDLSTGGQLALGYTFTPEASMTHTK